MLRHLNGISNYKVHIISENEEKSNIDGCVDDILGVAQDDLVFDGQLDIDSGSRATAMH